MSNRKDDKSFKSLFVSCHVFQSSYLVMRLAACYLHMRELLAAGEFSENVMDARRQLSSDGVKHGPSCQAGEPLKPDRDCHWVELSDLLSRVVLVQDAAQTPDLLFLCNFLYSVLAAF